MQRLTIHVAARSGTECAAVLAGCPEQRRARQAQPPPQVLRLCSARPAAVGVISSHRATPADLLGTCTGAWRCSRVLQDAVPDFLSCGVLAHALCRFRCSQCRCERLVALSCKRRSICPSCRGKRIAERASHIVKHVIPLLPARQWVLSLPHAFRYRLAYDHERMVAVFGLFVRAVLGFTRELEPSVHGRSNTLPAASCRALRIGKEVRRCRDGHLSARADAAPLRRRAYDRPSDTR